MATVERAFRTEPVLYCTLYFEIVGNEGKQLIFFVRVVNVFDFQHIEQNPFAEG